MRICKLDRAEQIWGRGGPVITTGITGYGNAAYKPADVALPGLPTISTPVTTQATFSITADPATPSGAPGTAATPAAVCPEGMVAVAASVSTTTTSGQVSVNVGAAPSISVNGPTTSVTSNVSCVNPNAPAPASVGPVGDSSTPDGPAPDGTTTAGDATNDGFA